MYLGIKRVKIYSCIILCYVLRFKGLFKNKGKKIYFKVYYIGLYLIL